MIFFLMFQLINFNDFLKNKPIELVDFDEICGSKTFDICLSALDNNRIFFYDRRADTKLFIWDYNKIIEYTERGEGPFEFKNVTNANFSDTVISIFQHRDRLLIFNNKLNPLLDVKFKNLNSKFSLFYNNNVYTLREIKLDNWEIVRININSKSEIQLLELNNVELRFAWSFANTNPFYMLNNHIIFVTDKWELYIIDNFQIKKRINLSQKFSHLIANEDFFKNPKSKKNKNSITYVQDIFEDESKIFLTIVTLDNPKKNGLQYSMIIINKKSYNIEEYDLNSLVKSFYKAYIKINFNFISKKYRLIISFLDLENEKRRLHVYEL